MVSYLYHNRPPGVGCQPDDWADRESWTPSREVDGRRFLGRVEYPRRLSADEILRYGLYPEDEIERAEHVVARETLESIVQEYASASSETLESFATHDPLAWATLALRRARWGYTDEENQPDEGRE